MFLRIAVLFFLFTGIGPAINLSITYCQGDIVFDRYHTPKEINDILTGFNRANPQSTKLHTLGVSPGKRNLLLLEIGPETKKTGKTMPAIFIVANIEGNVPVSGEAALFLADSLLKNKEKVKDLTWYILPCGNPDAAMRYFEKPLRPDVTNDRPYNDDMDDQTDEDGFDDLNGDGFITQMRVKAPDGRWIPYEKDPRILRKADFSKGEKGIYKLYSEGIDNDGDGEYNEDGPGGVNPGINFPHLFKAFTGTGGMWPGSEEESLGIIKFAFDHPEIAMTFTFGSTNFCMIPPKGGRRGEADLTKIKLPKWAAKMMNADPDKTYTLEEIMEKAKTFGPPGYELTESDVIGMLELGQAVNPQKDDLKFYKELAEQYKKFLKDRGMDGKRLDPAPAKDGSFELWSYYHLGLPAFSMDLWTLPKLDEKKDTSSGITPEQLEKMSNEEFLDLGEDKINAFLKETGAPPQFKAKMIMERMRSGEMDTKKMVEMIKKMGQQKDKKEPGEADENTKALVAFSDKELSGKGYVEWKPYKHPSLGDVEIGGEVPFTDNTPPARMIDSLLNGQVPWIFTLAEKLPGIKILKTEVKGKGTGIYELKLWIENTGYLPYPTSMGKRNKRIPPAIVLLEGAGFKIISGKQRTPVKSIEGHRSIKLEYIIHSEKPVNLNIKVETKSAWGDEKTVRLGK